MIQARLLPTSLQPETSLESYRNLIAQGRQVIAQERLKSRKKALGYARHIRERGYHDGYAAGLAAAQHNCQSAIDALKARYDEALSAAKADVQQLAQTLAEHIVNKALLERPEALARWINDSVNLLKRSRTLKLSYNPRYESIMEQVAEKIPQGVVAYSDSSLTDTDFVLEADSGGVEFAWKKVIEEAHASVLPDDEEKTA
jgi:flagellar biosynthesis/type III secretory pathway protein FliH